MTDLETDDGLDAHHTRLQALQKMSLSYPRLRETRDRCVQAHTGLMLAEAAQANARAELLIAQRRDAGGGGLPPDVTQRVASAIRKANDQLEVARVAFDHCRRETRALAVEFR